MTPAITSLIALGTAILVSCFSRINVGVMAIALAWVIGVYQAGWKPDAVIAGFPVSLFLMLAGVTLLFAMAETNGTLQRLTQRVVGLAGGSPRVLPVMFFLLGLAISSAGPGAISAVALLVPLAMPIGASAGVPPFLMALMVALGSNAGNLSPVSAVGVIANAKMVEAGIGAHEMKVWITNLLAHLLIGAVAYLWLAPTREDSREKTAGSRNTEDSTPSQVSLGLSPPQRLTVIVISAWIVAVVGFKLNVGLAAFAAASLLAVLQAADESAAVKRMPWGVIVMVSGITVLIGVLEKSGGMDLFAALLAKLATPGTINGSIAFITGLISTWSSTSGVVLPAFLPTVPALVANVGGGDPLAVALSINVGSALVDVSPLSTIGALCIAAVSDQAESRRLFRQMMIFGLAMAVVGAILMQLLAGAIASL
jgi:Na+/H+ antiporter NhaD/arsenite permease-like protein